MSLSGSACALGAQAAPAGDHGRGEWAAFFGAFHLVVLHFPMGFLALAGVLEAGDWSKPRPGARRSIQLALGAGMVAAWAAVGLGLLRAASGTFDPGIVAWHRSLGILLATLATTAWALHGRLATGRSTRVRGYRALLAATLGCLVATGHEGGSLTHGTRFLTENAPEPLAGLLGEERSPAAAPGLSTNPAGPPTAAGSAGDALFTTVVRPALVKKCFSCHGAEKQKGGLRLDLRSAALAGGKSGQPAIRPGDALASPMAKRITLPRGDDDAMPPEGREPLSDQEVGAILRWIESGAAYEPGN